jgi:hypothetical protein
MEEESTTLNVGKAISQLMENASRKNAPSNREELYKEQLAKSKPVIKKILEYFKNETSKG